MEGAGEAAAWMGCVERRVRGSGRGPANAWSGRPRRDQSAVTAESPSFAEKVAHNFARSFFEYHSKRCNSNDVDSKFEEAARELRAKLVRKAWRAPAA